MTIAGTLAIVLAVTAANTRYGKNAYLESLMVTGWLVPFLFSQRYTHLKGRPASAQALLIGGPATMVMAIALGAAWLNAH